MTTTDQTAAAVAARRAVADQAVERVKRTLKEMRRERAVISIAAIARRANVSRTFLYKNPAARDLIANVPRPSAHASAATGQPSTDTWRDRALNAESQLREAFNEIASQRDRIGALLGEIRQLQLNLPEEGVQRIMSENTTLRTRLRDAEGEARRSTERLAGARDNNRFLDKRVADLEAELLEVTAIKHSAPGKTEGGAD